MELLFATADEVRGLQNRKRVAAMVQRVAEVTPTVELTSADEIYDPGRDTKPRRVVDRRRQGTS